MTHVPSRPLHWTLFAASLLAATGVLAPWLSACSGAEDATTGRRVTLATEFSAHRPLTQPVVLASGWTLELSGGWLGVGSLHYFDGAPPIARRATPAWQQWLLPSVAHAHPGHYQSGSPLGEMLSPSALDIADLPLAGAAGAGVTGVYRSARLTLAPSGAPELDGAVARLVGVATKPEREPVHFDLSAGFEDVAASATSAKIEGCPFDEVEVKGDGTITLSVDVSVWASLLDFEGVAPGSSAAPTRFVSGDRPRIAFALGVAQLSAYRLTFTPTETP